MDSKAAHITDCGCKHEPVFPCSLIRKAVALESSHKKLDKTQKAGARRSEKKNRNRLNTQASKTMEMVVNYSTETLASRQSGKKMLILEFTESDEGRKQVYREEASQVIN